MKYPAHPELLIEFARWWDQNQTGGWDCTWRRRPVWVAQLLQKIGMHQEVSVPLFFGEQMRIITGETVSTSILSFGYSEVAITALMLFLVRPGQVFVDIGTHFGYEALLACKLVGRQGQVICFEPSPATFAIAQKNLTHFPQAKLHCLAIAEKPGSLKFQNRTILESAFNSLVMDQKHGDCVEVSVTTLDQILENRTQTIDFIKCDVEGLEIEILKGANKLLGADSPVIVLEADMPSPDGKVSPRALELAAYLEAYNYQALSFDFDGNLRLGEINSFPVFHANIAFIPRMRVDILAFINKKIRHCIIER
ncbi:FkbM family methyltransferase [Fortiea sp. LEGE XX443]|uniref:FkbM family methyltransferase n=1 Tax=Fortiea sp. LEGE XX443 TaxID=1828611 RepID=UPI001880556E|nr:FkbM family methyltransferase [Fortiea sp. LEGE XX443]MBE9005333.1 FkbM family methyltransferase [Fortiea sp. LEGE XX443]